MESPFIGRRCLRNRYLKTSVVNKLPLTDVFTIVNSGGFSELSLLLTLGCEVCLAWRDVRSLSAPLCADGEVKCEYKAGTVTAFVTVGYVMAASRHVDYVGVRYGL